MQVGPPYPIACMHAMPCMHAYAEVGRMGNRRRWCCPATMEACGTLSKIEKKGRYDEIASI